MSDISYSTKYSRTPGDSITVTKREVRETPIVHLKRNNRGYCIAFGRYGELSAPYTAEELLIISSAIHKAAAVLVHDDINPDDSNEREDSR
ncbi:hypothetical protein [Bifidobacterium tissieri]|uniref:Uncharacterized protein n=1 Tax=Bifidobacterium tissieri TaxID=1630162 RepID=A0A5M9ZLX7_9BIFI|nr:hypothetical protein [Bifidobacterium tissieri]KAA8828647.1 hypothetical protein EM849_11460 [Bifidobacterium tissieri]KAA8831590.1 hypothetical protein EMO89_02375 [Bifidobacterium tissieri]